MKKQVLVALLSCCSTGAMAQVGINLYTGVPTNVNCVVIGTGVGSSSNPGATDNTFVGYQAANAIATGLANTIVGSHAGEQIQTGNANVFVGHYAGNQTAAGNENTFVGQDCGTLNTASFNTFVGKNAGRANTVGVENTFVGNKAAGANDQGSYNTFIGTRSGSTNQFGIKNTVLGHSADLGSANLTYATAIGYNANVNSSFAVVLGGIDSNREAVNVGIGTRNPGTKLHIESTAGNANSLHYAKNGNGIADLDLRTGTGTLHDMNLTMYNTSAPGLLAGIAGSNFYGLLSTRNAALILSTYMETTPQNMHFVTGITAGGTGYNAKECMRINQGNGFVGVHTWSATSGSGSHQPQALFHVNLTNPAYAALNPLTQGIRFEGLPTATSAHIYSVVADASGNLALGTGGGGTGGPAWLLNGNSFPIGGPADYIGTNTPHDFAMWTNSTPRARITTDGNWDFGSNTISSSAVVCGAHGAANNIKNASYYDFVIGANNTLDVSDRTLTVGITNSVNIGNDIFTVGGGNTIYNTGETSVSGRNNNVSSTVHGLISGESNQINSDIRSTAFGYSNYLTNSIDNLTSGNTNTVTSCVAGLVAGTGNSVVTSRNSNALGEGNNLKNCENVLAAGLTNNIDNSHFSGAIGRNNQISYQDGVFAAGDANTITNPGSIVSGCIALGQTNNVANSLMSVAVGGQNAINNAVGSFTAGFGNATGTGSYNMNIGSHNTIPNNSSNNVTLGDNLTASGNFVHSYGSGVVNTLNGSIAMGFNNRTLTVTGTGVGINGQSGTSYAPSHDLEVDAPVGGNSDVAFINLPQSTNLPAVLYDPSTGKLYQSTFTGYARQAPTRNGGNKVVSDPVIEKAASGITKAADILSRITPNAYTEDGEKYPILGLEDGKHTYGLNAIEVQKVLPALVSDVPASDNGETVKAINYNEFIPLLIQSFKEQQAQIAELKAALTKQKESTAVLNLDLSDEDQILLEQNVPNPCDNGASIGFHIPASVKTAVLKFSAMDGKAIKSYMIAERGKGVINVSTATLAQGTYTYSLYADGQLIDTKKMVIVK